MSSVIYKYEIKEGVDLQIVNIPKDPIFLSMQWQYGKLCMWMMVNPKNEPTAYEFMTYGTGHPINDPGLGYVGTYQSMGGAFVGHVFLKEKV